MVNINGINWRILLVSSNHPSLFDDQDKKTLGCCDRDLKTIYIEEGLNDFYLKKVICHELVHACMYSYQVNLNLYQEEVFADLIATYGSEIIEISNSLFKRLSERK